MKNKAFFWIIILSLIVGFFLRPLILPCDETIIHTDTVFVDAFYRDTIYQDVPVPIYITRIDTVIKPQIMTRYKVVYSKVDTNAILADWGLVRTYSDTLIDNSEVFIHLSEKVAKNALFDRKLVYETRCRDVIITNKVYRNGFYYGGSVSLRLDISLNLGYQMNKNIFIVGLEPVDKDISFGFLRKF